MVSGAQRSAASQSGNVEDTFTDETTEIESVVAEELDEDPDDVEDATVRDAISAVTEEQVSDKPMNSGDVDTNDPEDRESPDPKDSPEGQAKQQLDEAAQRFQDVLEDAAQHTGNAAEGAGVQDEFGNIANDTVGGLGEFGETIAAAVSGDDSDSSGDESDGEVMSAIGGGNVQLLLFGLIALGAIYALTQRNGGDS